MLLIAKPSTFFNTCSVTEVNKERSLERKNVKSSQLISNSGGGLWEGDKKVLSLCLGDDGGSGRLVVSMDVSLKSFQYL